MKNVQESAALDDSDSLEFPVPNLIELEGRVFVEMWSIPYRRDESLARCLISTTRLVEAGKCFYEYYESSDVIFHNKFPVL